MSEKIDFIEIKLKNLDKINFDKKVLINEFEEVLRRNDKLIESTKVDTDSLSKKFEI